MRDHFATGCLILGILCFLYFVGIIFYAGIRTSIAGIWVLAGAAFLLLWKGLCLMQMPRFQWLKIPVTAAAGILLAALVVILIFGSRVIRSMSARPQNGREYVLVLGAQVKGVKPSRSLKRRLDCAIDYAKENPDTIFILTGGKGEDEGISEAECMYQYLTEHQVSSSRLLLEDRSTSTKENLVFSDQKYDLAGRKIGIISNGFHIYRALELARQCGYQDAAGIPASSDLFLLPHNIIREICCLLLMKLS